MLDQNQPQSQHNHTQNHDCHESSSSSAPASAPNNPLSSVGVEHFNNSTSLTNNSKPESNSNSSSSTDESNEHRNRTSSAEAENECKMDTSTQALHSQEDALSEKQTIKQPTHFLSSELQASLYTESYKNTNTRSPEVVKQFIGAIHRNRLVTINLTQVGLTSLDAHTLKDAILQNPHLTTLKLAYNNLGDDGASIIASAIGTATSISTKLVTTSQTPPSQDTEQSIEPISLTQHQQHYNHHPSLSTLDLGFNRIGDVGCTALASNAIPLNYVFQTLYLSGNAIGEKGTCMLAAAILNGCGISCLHLTANQISATGTKALTRAIAQIDNSVSDASTVNTEGFSPQQQQAEQESKTCQIKSVVELFLGGTSMQSEGCLSVSNMILRNRTLRVISLCGTEMNDRDLALFSQSIAQNKKVPLEVIQLSFNKLTCRGVESLMNAVWGSETLREIALDNNRIRDRGAQLAAVVLTSVKLEVLNLGFNIITVVGIRAIMKNLKGNTTLKSLTLSGNVMNVASAKAMSFALAHNVSLQNLFLDNCHLDFETQRHIAAGIVSNAQLALAVLTGFHLGVIVTTLGFPKELEIWSNDGILGFIQFMWYTTKQEGQPLNGPVNPSKVVSAAKKALEEVNSESAQLFMTNRKKERFKDPAFFLLSPRTAKLSEMAFSGAVKEIILDQEGNVCKHVDSEKDSQSKYRHPILCPQSAQTQKEDSIPVNPKRKERNIEWVQRYMKALEELRKMPFKESDLWQLHRYFFSPIQQEVFNESKTEGSCPSTPLSSSPTETSSSKNKSLSRKMSFRHLNDATMSSSLTELSFERTCKRGTSQLSLSTAEDTSDQPSVKRARNNKTRIDHYPRIKRKILSENADNQNEVLNLFRQVKFVEGTLFQDTNKIYGGDIKKEKLIGDLSEPCASDLESILLDLLCL